MDERGGHGLAIKGREEGAREMYDADILEGMAITYVGCW